MESFLRLREINYLVHFTNIKNLNSILTHGLITRDALISSNTQYCYNDENRHDGLKNGICCSIMFPNYKMFYPLRINNPDEKWCVLVINKNVLYNRICVFSNENAASHNVTSMNIGDRLGLNGLSNLYRDDIQGWPKRNTLNIPNSFPTNPQSEVIVLGNIPLDLIQGVVFSSEEERTVYTQLYPNLNTVVYTDFFYPRQDHNFW
ncbi:DarT ssDNA thymidine ADP-ribosyltransferase family protein [Malaciobacter sp. WC5094]